MDKVPPHNLEAERSILGGLMLEPEAWDDVSESVTEDDFYRPAHKKIYAAIRELSKQGQPSDIITVSNYLIDKNELDLIGGPAYLAELIDQTPSVTNITSYCKIVTDKALIRRLIHSAQEIVDKGYEQDFKDVESFVDGAEASVFAIAEKRNDSGLVEASELVKGTLEKLEELYALKSDVTGVASGFTELDDMTAGFQSGEIIILAARPSMGKTAFSLNLCIQAALREKRKVAYFSLEMSKEQLMIRLLSIASKVPLGALRIGQLDDKAWPRLINTAAAMSDAGLFIDDTSGISPFEVRARARRLKAKHGLDMIIIDYLQLMSMKQRIESREREVAEISKTLKAIAKELKVPVIALAQLNRGVEGRSDRRPMLSDLRESGSIEQDADIIMMLYREDYYDRDNPEIQGISEVIVGKQRNGPTGAVKLNFKSEYGIFQDLDRSGPAPPPPEEPPASFQNTQQPQQAPKAGGPPPNLAPGR